MLTVFQCTLNPHYVSMFSRQICFYCCSAAASWA